MVSPSKVKVYTGSWLRSVPLGVYQPTTGSSPAEVRVTSSPQGWVPPPCTWPEREVFTVTLATRTRGASTGSMLASRGPLAAVSCW